MSLQQYQSGTQTRRVAQLAEAEPEPVAEMHPSLASASASQTGDKVRLRTRRGEAVMTAGIGRPASGQDTVFAPFHWGGAANVNRLTNPALDPHSTDAGVQGLRGRRIARRCTEDGRSR